MGHRVFQTSRGFVEHQLPSKAPDAGSVLKFGTALVWKSKWLISAAVLLSAVLTYALTVAGETEIWSGRGVLTVGMTPASEFLAQRSGPALAPIEGPRVVAALLSAPTFREKIAGRASFEPPTAAASREMVTATLRGIALDSERNVGIEVSAGSAADVRTAFRTIAEEIGAAHRGILERQLQVLQNRIDGNKDRIAAIEREIDALNEYAFKTVPYSRANEPPRSLPPPVVVMKLAAWNELQAQVSDDVTLKQLAEPSILPFEADSLVVTQRSIERLRSSLLAGAGMLVAMIILTIAVGPPRRSRAD